MGLGIWLYGEINVFLLKSAIKTIINYLWKIKVVWVQVGCFAPNHNKNIEIS